MYFQDDSDRLFDSLTDLTSQQIDVVKHRYKFLLAEYRHRALFYSVLFYTLRMTMTVGSLAVPALLSIQTNPANQATMYWFTWALSLAVTTANGLMTLFKLDRRFFMLHATMEKLRTEMWQYVELSGRYSGHHGHQKPTHANQYVYFCSHLEKIRMKHIEEEYIKMAENHDPPSQPLPPSVPGQTSTATTNIITNSAPGVPSPPDQALLTSPSPALSISTVSSSSPPLNRTKTKSLMRSGSKLRSQRNSASTSGSDDSIIELGIQDKETETPIIIKEEVARPSPPDRQAPNPETNTVPGIQQLV
jgi:hypothetical protein